VAVRSFAELGKTLAVLLALWGILGAIGYFAGAFPSVDPRTDDLDAGLAASEDAGVAEDAAQDPGEPDAWIEAEDDTGRVEALESARVCAAPSDIAWALGDLAGDAGEEIVIGCSDRVDIVALPEVGMPARIARIVPTRATMLQSAAIGDVDADQRNDLVLAMEVGLFVVPRDGSGGLAAARALAPARHGALALGELDATAGLDIAVVHGADPRAELWLFHGGPTPVRAGTAPAPLETVALAVVDLDIDGHLDVVAVGAQQILLAFGDSRAGIARTRSLTPGGRGASVLDTDGDGVAEVLVERDGAACVLDPAPALADVGDCTPLPSLDATARSWRVVADGLVAIRHPDLVAWTPAGTSTLATLATTRFGVHRVTRDARGLVLLGSSVDEAGLREIELARAPLDVALGDANGRTDVVDAPLVLALTLPDPDAP
jgi:hypothetical protein